MSNALKGYLGYKGERGYSAYEIAVQQGFEGTVDDWLATLGTSSHFAEDKTIYTATKGQTEFTLPSAYTTNSFVEVYLEGQRLNSEQYTLDTTNRKIVLTNAIDVEGTKLEVVLLTMSTNSLPIVSTINADSTNDTAPGTKAVYDYVEGVKTTKLDKSNIAVLTGSVANIQAGTTAITDINYPAGFTKSNTVIIGDMVSSNDSYYDVKDLDTTSSGFPSISMIALTDDVIRVWLKNTSVESTRTGYYKITLLKID